MSVEFNNLFNKISELRSSFPPTNNFYLPFTSYKDLYLVFFIQEQMKQYSKYLKYPNSRIAGVYGSFSNIIWNGGRSISKSEFNTIEQQEKCLSKINNNSLICKFTFTNSLLKEEHCKDQRGNELLNLIAETNNEIVIFSNILENYIRERYPSIQLTSSITKGNDINTLQNNINKDYKAVVCYPKQEILSYIDSLSSYNQQKIELMLNDDGCAQCTNNFAHFQHESYNNLYDNKTPFNCKWTQQNEKQYKYLLNLPQKDQLFYNIQYFQDLNIHNYKIRGRGESFNNLVSTYINILFMPEIHIEIYNNINNYFKKREYYGY